MTRSGHGLWIAVLAPVLLTLLLVSCETIDGTRGVPPFYEVYPTPSSYREAVGSETYYRPFFSSETSHPLVQDAGEMRRIRSFPPLIDVGWAQDENHVLVLPLFLQRGKRHPDGKNDTDWLIMPFFYWGNDPVGGAYFAFFPFGGKLKGLLGQRDVTFAMFPFFWLARDLNDKKSLHVLWPFYNTVWGDGWSGWRVWPFYGRYDAVNDAGEPRLDRSFVFWPFYIRAHEQLQGNAQDLFLTVPAYGYRESRRSVTRTYLWPFFQTHHDLVNDQKTYMGFIIPYYFTEGQADLWPLFGHKEQSQTVGEGLGVARQRYRHYVLWPFERYDWTSDGTQEATRFWLIPLLWHFYYVNTDTLQTEKEWKVWPFYRYRRHGSEVEFDALSPFWFQEGPLRRFYSRWFSIFRYRNRQSLGGWEILYGAIRYRTRPPEDERVFSILGGLLEFGSRNDATVFRMLYIPWLSPTRSSQQEVEGKGAP